MRLPGRLRLPGPVRPEVEQGRGPAVRPALHGAGLDQDAADALFAATPVNRHTDETAAGRADIGVWHTEALTLHIDALKMFAADPELAQEEVETVLDRLKRLRDGIGVPE